MKNFIKTAIFLSILAVLAGCKTREKQVQKSETQTENKSEASAKIETKTFEIIFDKSVLKNDFSYKNSSEETSKNEKKNVEKGDLWVGSDGIHFVAKLRRMVGDLLS